MVKKITAFLLGIGLIFSTTAFDYSDAATKKNPPTCTLKEFKKIKTGMTLTNVRKIIGSKGTLISEASAGGFTSKVYEFKGNRTYSSVIISFTNGKVDMKSQYGLK